MSSNVRISVNREQVVGILHAKDAQSKLDEAADAALRMQESLVPIDTGALKKSLAKRDIEDGLGRQIGSFNVDYARAVEEGWTTKSGKHVPAQPYVRPSIDAVRKTFK